VIQPTDISDDSATTEQLPGALNIAILIVAIAIASFALWAASNSNGWITILLAATVFSFVNNTIFSLLHEAVHGLFHSNHKANEFFGSLCAAFAVNWSALQYADHAWTERDVRNGAWNLRVNPLVRYLFLNYHHHKAHHQHTNVSWLYLPKYVDYLEHRPSFLSVYWNMWLGPRPYPEVPPGILGKEKC